MKSQVDWRTLDLRGTSGPIGNTFLSQDASRIAVVLPGFMGGWSTPATYYPVLALLDRGFDALCLDSVYREHPPVDVLTADARAAVEAGRRAGDYSEVAVVGKSLGTVAVTELVLSGAMPRSTMSIWLTPLLRSERTIAALEALQRRALIVIGTADPHFDQAALDALVARGHVVEVIAGANHGLTVDGDAVKSAQIPPRLVAAVHGYIGAAQN